MVAARTIFLHQVRMLTDRCHSRITTRDPTNPIVLKVSSSMATIALLNSKSPAFEASLRYHVHQPCQQASQAIEALETKAMATDSLTSTDRKRIKRQPPMRTRTTIRLARKTSSRASTMIKCHRKFVTIKSTETGPTMMTTLMMKLLPTSPASKLLAPGVQIPSWSRTSDINTCKPSVASQHLLLLFAC